MNRTKVQEVQSWFAGNSARLSGVFSAVHLKLLNVKDQAHGKATIQVDASSVGASVTFWNKGDVEAIILEKENKRDYSIDDRVLKPNEDVGQLLNRYFDKIEKVMSETASVSHS